MVHDARSPHADHVTASQPAWAALLPSALEADGLPGLAPGAVPAFDDPDLETSEVLAGAAALVPLVTRGALRLTGADRIDFLHGQISHDVRGMQVGQALQALLLDHRGRPRGDLVVVRRDDDLYVAIDDARAPIVQRALDAHVIFDQVVIQDLSRRLASFVVAGEAALGALAQILAAETLPTVPGAAMQLPWRGADVLLHARPRGLPASLDVHLLREQLEDLWQALLAAGARPRGERALAAARVAAGLAAAAAEGEGALPQESGLEDRVSYRKGCYLGQEIMARVEARASLRRSLARLSFAERPQPPFGAGGREVHDTSGRSVGRVGTVAWLPVLGWAALAVLRSDVEEAAGVAALGVAGRVAARLA